MTLLYSKEGRGPAFTEALIVILAIAGFIAGLTRKGIAGGHAGFVQALGFFTLVMTAAYSIIPYKTPWCLLSFLSGMILLAGVGAVALVNVLRSLPMKIVAGSVLVAASAHLGAMILAILQGRPDLAPFAGHRRL